MESDPPQNPFKLPEFKSIFDLHEANERARKEENAKRRQMNLIDKLTHGKQITSRKVLLAEEEESVKSQLHPKEDTKIILDSTKGKHVENETHQEYIANQRKMFLAEYSIAVQLHEISRLEELAQREEKKLELAEQCLEQDAALFDEFLRDNDKSSVEAIAAAEQESRKRAALSDEIKQLTGQQLKISAEINRLKEILVDYKSYRDFLEKLIPEKLRLQLEGTREERRKAKQHLKDEEQRKSALSRMSQVNKIATEQPVRRASILMRRRSSVKLFPFTRSATAESKTPQPVQQDSSESEDENEEVAFFKSPKEVLEILSDLEEANLRLIQHCQEIQENIDLMKNVTCVTKEKIELDRSHLIKFHHTLEEDIHCQAERTNQLSVNVSDFEFAGMDKGEQEALLNLCHEQIAASYKQCMHKTEVSMSSMQMLNDLEQRLIRLIQLIHTLPGDQVKAMLQIKEREHRIHVKLEKKNEQRLHQEERVRRALERAKAEPKKVTGRRLMTRSEPIKKEQTDKRDQEALMREEEEMMFLFS
ncbi:Coiled-coil domain-containing protein 37 [Fasciola hepatica]|uniref:Coiled-coil domain-containing protein 37 n=1 Tax=Fasciola hepatica TaxID=6192 RepID=A0A4E0RRC5_FASHE|nr:Coiled-coil domain-containing protein 37 [Fasciola hepatica]